MPKQSVRECTTQLQNALINSKPSKDNNGDTIAEKKADISGTMLREELQSLKSILPDEFQDTVNPEKLLKYLSENNRHKSFHNVFIAVKLFLTIPVFVASGERSISKLKLIKTYLRSTMKQKQFNSLALLLIENDILKVVNVDSTIKYFASKKSRKVGII